MILSFRSDILPKELTEYQQQSFGCEGAMSKLFKKHKKIKKRFIFLQITAFVMLLFFVRYIDIVGDSYDVNTMIIADRAFMEKITYSFEPEGIVEVTGVSLSNDSSIIISVKSLRQGETHMTVKSPDVGADEGYIRETDLRVTIMGTVIEDAGYFVNFNGYQLVTGLFLLLMAAIMGVMIYSFAECCKKSDYSYKMVAYGGIALFLAVLLTMIGYKIANNVVTTFTSLISLIMQVGRWFIILLAPFLMVMAVALSVSNIWLLRHEGFRPVNALGIVLSVVWIAGVALTSNIIRFGDQVAPSDVWVYVQYALTFIITYFECMLISTSVCAFLSARYTPPYDRDYIIILGCAIRRDGSLTPLLKGRADAALQFEKRQFEKTGKHACFVPSGGQGADEIISEGEAMERYLLSQGVEQKYIKREDKSVNTFENMQFSKKVIEENTDDISREKIAFSTTNYHVFRGYILAAKNGFEAKGISAKTKWYFFPNAFIREFIGLLVDQMRRHISLIGLIVLIMIVIMRIS